MQSTGIVVLGMHRSGTSACTGLLRLYGAYLGEVIDGHTDNPKGYWENKMALSLDDEVLALLQCRWDWPWVFPEQWLDQIPDKLSRRRDAVIADLCAQPLWAMKDPRMCLLWPWWQTGFTQTNSQIKALICLRHPMQVAQSLARRNQVETGQALLLWAQHVLSAEQHSRGMRRAVIFYDDILGSSTQAIIHIQNRLGIIFPASPGQDVLNDFITAGLHHHHDNECPDSAIGRLCQEIFTACYQENALEQTGEWDEFRARLMPLLRQDSGNRLPWALAEILRLDNSQIAVITECKHVQAELNQTQTELAQIQTELAQIQTELAQTQTELAQTQTELAQTQVELTGVLSSRSWRFTALLRSIGYRLRNLKGVTTKLW